MCLNSVSYSEVFSNIPLRPAERTRRTNCVCISHLYAGNKSFALCAFIYRFTANYRIYEISYTYIYIYIYIYMYMYMYIYIYIYMYIHIHIHIHIYIYI